MFDIKEVVTSRQNPTVKMICSLSDKKGRRAEGLFRFDGIKLFCEALNAGLDIRYVVVREDAWGDMEARVGGAIDGCRKNGASVFTVSVSVFDKLSDERSPEGVITVARFPSELHREIEADKPDDLTVRDGETILIAESLRDPGNLGTVVRSCAVLGISRLLISDDCADLYNPKLVRAAMGGLFRLNIDVIPVGRLPDVIRTLRGTGRRIYAAALRDGAYEIGTLRLRRGDCFVIGNEGHGLSDAVIDACDACAVIPMTAGSESLNAAAAAAICIWETVR